MKCELYAALYMYAQSPSKQFSFHSLFFLCWQSQVFLPVYCKEQENCRWCILWTPHWKKNSVHREPVISADITPFLSVRRNVMTCRTSVVACFSLPLFQATSVGFSIRKIVKSSWLDWFYIIIIIHILFVWRQENGSDFWQRFDFSKLFSFLLFETGHCSFPLELRALSNSRECLTSVWNDWQFPFFGRL